jgi:hypothetical protein
MSCVFVGLVAVALPADACLARRGARRGLGRDIRPTPLAVADPVPAPPSARGRRDDRAPPSSIERTPLAIEGTRAPWPHATRFAARTQRKCANF